jgi:hypothetical protein
MSSTQPSYKYVCIICKSTGHYMVKKEDTSITYVCSETCMKAYYNNNLVHKTYGQAVRTCAIM